MKWILICLALSLLAFFTWPKLQRFECRATQSEAKAMLNHFYEAEKFYYAHHHRYASLNMLIHEGLIRSIEKHYTYQTESYGTKDFRIIATGKTLLSDKWSVDQTGQIRVLTNACIF